MAACKHSTQLNYECDFFTGELLYHSFNRNDSFQLNQNDDFLYRMELMNIENPMVEEYRFCNPNKPINCSISFYDTKGDEASTKIIGKKIFEIDGKEMTVIKYHFNGIAEDNSSNHFFVNDFGIILSFFWKSNKMVIRTEHVKAQKIIGELQDSIISNKWFYKAFTAY